VSGSIVEYRWCRPSLIQRVVELAVILYTHARTEEGGRRERVKMTSQSSQYDGEHLER
jgi:hypothetical protein